MNRITYTLSDAPLVMTVGKKRTVGGGGAGARPAFGGHAVVCCVHDREKRVVTTEAQVAVLGLEAGVVFDPRQHRIHRCACCDNLFFDPSDEPRYCVVCNPSRLVHPLGGPLNLPIGEVDG